MKMKSQRKALRDRAKRTLAAAGRQTGAQNDNTAGDDSFDDLDLDVARRIQGYDE